MRFGRRRHKEEPVDHDAVEDEKDLRAFDAEDDDEPEEWDEES